MGKGFGFMGLMRLKSVRSARLAVNTTVVAERLPESLIESLPAGQPIVSNAT